MSNEGKYLVIGRGLVGSAFADDGNVDIVSHDEWHHASKCDYDGVILAAAMSTEPRCQAHTMKQVLEANVKLPVRVAELTRARNIPLVMFSTAGVYRIAGYNNECADIDAHNRYTASKIMMEHQLINHHNYSRLYIFRIPFVCFFNNHHNDLSGRIRNWKKVEDITASIVYKGALINACMHAIRTKIPNGIYNIASGNVHFPVFLEDRFNWKGDIVPPSSLGKTPNSQLDCGKARNYGLLPRWDKDRHEYIEV